MATPDYTADAAPNSTTSSDANSALLANGKEDQRYGSPSLACDKALAVLEYEDDRQAVIDAPAEEAMRRGMFEAEQDRGDSAGDDWVFQPSCVGRDGERLEDRNLDDGGRER